MDTIQGISANNAPYAINANAAVTLTSDLLAAELSPLSQGLFGGASSIVETSSVGQLLAAASTFHDSLTGLQSGIATNAIDSTNVASYANTLTGAFNALQTSIANINGIGNLFGGGTLDGVDLAQALNSQSLATYPNGASALTNLSQLGIAFNPAAGFQAGALSVNQDTLQSAFNADPAGVRSLLGQAVNAFGTLANTFVTQVGGQYAALSTLTQLTAFNSLFDYNQAGSLLGNDFGLIGLLVLQNQSQNLFGSADMRNALLALSNYEAVSRLFS